MKFFVIRKICLTGVFDGMAGERGEIALEYMTPIKGIDTSNICRRIGSGRITAPEAAADYDEECRKMALKIGLWE